MKNKYREVIVRKKRINKGVLATLVIIFVFAFVFILSFFLSPIIKIANVSSSNQYLYEKEYYFVMLKLDTSNKQEAQKEAQNLKSRGGAGVLLFENNYFVIVSFYETKEDAKSVSEKLSNEEQTFVLKEQKISTNTKNLSQNETEIVLKYYNYFIDKINEIQKLSNSLDSKTLSSISANLKLKSIKTESCLMLDFLINENNPHFEQIKNSFLSFASALEYSSEQSHLNSAIIPYSSVLREMMILSILNFCTK